MMKSTLALFIFTLVTLGAKAQIGNVSEPQYIPSYLSKIEVLPQTLSMKNQYMLNECYLYAYTHFIEHGMLHTRKLKSPLSISAEYLYARKLYEIIERRLDGYRSDLYFEGGYFFDAIYLTEKYGLVPESLWQPKKTVFQFDYIHLNRLIDNTTYSIPSEFNMDLMGLQTMRAELTPEAEVKAKVQELKDKYLLPLKEMFGDLPTEFVVDGKAYTPKTYAEEFDISSYTKMHVHFPKDKLDRVLYDQSKARFKDLLKNQVPVTHEILNESQMTHEWVKAIDQRNPVFVNIHWAHTRHGMVIVGYERDLILGQIVRFKLQNSWGISWSDSGYAWYTPQDLYKNLINSVSIEASSIRHQKDSQAASPYDVFGY